MEWDDVPQRCGGGNFTMMTLVETGGLERSAHE
jgi:hypothetical protein